jgi:hypothetical protein
MAAISRYIVGWPQSSEHRADGAVTRDKIAVSRVTFQRVGGRAPHMLASGI